VGRLGGWRAAAAGGARVACPHHSEAARGLRGWGGVGRLGVAVVDG
jgi:hypothetical protein